MGRTYLTGVTQSVRPAEVPCTSLWGAKKPRRAKLPQKQHLSQRKSQKLAVQFCPWYEHAFPLRFCSTQRVSLLNFLHLPKLLQPALHSVLRFYGLCRGQKTKSITCTLHSTSLLYSLFVFSIFYFIDGSHINKQTNKSLISKSF